MRSSVWFWAIVMVIVGLLGACGSDGTPSPSIGESDGDALGPSTQPSARSAAEPQSTTDPSTAQPSTTASPIAAFNGRPAPREPVDVTDAVALYGEVAIGLRDETAAGDWPDLGHQQQIVVRWLARRPERHEEFLDGLPADQAATARLHLAARASLGSLHTAPPLETIPTWAIIDPEPLKDLVSYYSEAEAATGIDWRVLAGINLIETGMGRIDGLSSAGAQGPMQFLPTTWEEVADGGDIDDPHDSIQGAARYLVRRGGLDDIRSGLWGYNNSDDYVDAVLTYAELLELDERELRGFYNWEIYVGTDVGTLWLPVGFITEEPMPARDYLARNPWARTLTPTSGTISP